MGACQYGRPKSPADKGKIVNLANFTTEQLREFNKAVVAELNRRHAEKQIAASRKFNIGDVVQFTHNTRGPITIRIDRINLKSMHGKCQRTGMPWRVSPGLCHHVVQAGNGTELVC